MHVPHIRAITNAEFVQMMGRCRPPTGWPITIGMLTLTFSAAETLNTRPSCRELRGAGLYLSPLSPPTYGRLETKERPRSQRRPS